MRKESLTIKLDRNGGHECTTWENARSIYETFWKSSWGLLDFVSLFLKNYQQVVGRVPKSFIFKKRVFLLSVYQIQAIWIPKWANKKHRTRQKKVFDFKNLAWFSSFLLERKSTKPQTTTKKRVMKKRLIVIRFSKIQSFRSPTFGIRRPIIKQFRSKWPNMAHFSGLYCKWNYQKI